MFHILLVESSTIGERCEKKPAIQDRNTDVRKINADESCLLDKKALINSGRYATHAILDGFADRDDIPKRSYD